MAALMKSLDIPKSAACLSGGTITGASAANLSAMTEVVYQKDLGEETLKIFASTERYNPDKTWHRTNDNWPTGVAVISE